MLRRNRGLDRARLSGLRASEIRSDAKPQPVSHHTRPSRVGKSPMNEMKLETIAPLLAGFAVLGTVFGVVLRGWTSIKGLINSVFRIVLTQVHTQVEATSQAVLAHLIRKYKRSTMCEKTFGGRHESFRDGKH